MSLQKHWPNTVVVTVRENVAVAVAFNAAHVLDYVDLYGVPLGPAPPHENLPTLEYLASRGVELALCQWPAEALPTWPVSSTGIFESGVGDH